MTVPCHPLPASTIQILFQDMARALCDRPEETPAQREARTTATVRLVLGFEPRDGVEFMFSTVAVGHFSLILDAMRDVFQGQTDSVKARTKSGIVVLDRAMLTMVKEFRMARARPVAEEARREAAARTETARATPEAAPRETTLETTRKAPAEAPADTAGNTSVQAETSPAEARPDTAPSLAETRPDTAPSLAETRPDTATVAFSLPEPSPAADTTDAWPMHPHAGAGASAARFAAVLSQAGMAYAGMAQDGMAQDGEPPDTLEENFMAFQEAFRAMAETLEEARSHDRLVLETNALDQMTREPV